MFKEYDVIRAKKIITDKVPEGCLGTILIVHDAFSRVYEVEFVDENEDMIEVLTVPETSLEIAST